ncbi:MAG: hypothetical protein NC453_12085 [Muribaculum sp.]|nr:hypothetical protein [Muribaculum sp.]
MEYKVNHAGKDVLFLVDDIEDSYLRRSACEAIKNFYSQFSSKTDGEIVLTYRLTDHIDDFFNTDEDAIMSESAKINSNQVFANGHGNKFGYEFINGKLTTIYYNLVSPGRIGNNKHKAISRAFLSNVENQIAMMYSRGFLHGLQLKNIEEGASFMHACSFAVGNNGYVVAATPGAGKSSLLLSMSFDTDLKAKFISDDFAYADSNGNAHFIGRSMAIKSHQIQYFPELKNRFDDMSFWQKMQWFVLKKRGLKRMGTPTQIFGNNITTNVPIKRVIYLTNHNKDTFEHVNMPTDEFADLNANMLFSELFLGMEIVNHSLILPGHHLLPTADRFISETRETLSKIFKDTPCVLVKVPFRSDPRKLLEYLKRESLIE